MSVKKNLTIATLAALLAVPAFSSNINPTTKIHADTMQATEANQHARNDAISAVKSIGAHSVNGGLNNSGSYSANYNGHHIVLSDSDSSIDGRPASYTDISALINGSMHNGSSNGTNNNNGTEYQNSKTNNGKLVQTGESNDGSKVAVLGATSLTTGVALLALSFAKKHRDMEATDVITDTPNISGSGNDDTPHYSAKSNYHMIMSNTFADISKDIKNM